jgi:hypothetical protein
MDRDNLGNSPVNRCIGPFSIKVEKLEENGSKDVLNGI